MPKFATEEWAKEYMKELNQNDAYKEAASWWEGDFIFVIKPSGPLEEEKKMWIGLYHGDCTGASVVEEGEEIKILEKGQEPSGNEPPPYEAEYIYEAKYDDWVKILKGELDPIRALLSGKAKITGDMAKVMRATKAAQELVRTTTIMDTEFY